MIFLSFSEHVIPTLCVNPNHLEDSLEAMELGVREFGIKVIGELCQYIHNYRTDGPEMLQVAQKAVELGAPVHLHCSDETHGNPRGSSAP